MKRLLLDLCIMQTKSFTIWDNLHATTNRCLVILIYCLIKYPILFPSLLKNTTQLGENLHSFNSSLGLRTVGRNKHVKKKQ